MPVLDTLSKRLARAANADKPEVYQYDKLPKAFRVQVCHIWGASIGPYVEADRYRTPPPSTQAWIEIHNAMAWEQGVFRLAPDGPLDPFVQCQNFVLNGRDAARPRSDRADVQNHADVVG